MGLYQDLDISSNATAQQIKNAYRKKAKKSHPDAGGKKGEFEKVQKAYLVLSDPETRSKYDKTGDENLEEPDNSQQEIISIVVTAFEITVQCIENTRRNPLEFDIAKEMKGSVESKIREIETEIKRLERNIKNTEKFLGRFSVKKGNNFIDQMLASKIDAINLNIKFKKHDVEKFSKALELIKDLSFRVEPKKEQEYYSGMMNALIAGS